MTAEIITTQNDFERMVGDLSESSWLAVDTEFIRESSYYPKLCLIQIATEHICTCVDVLALSDISCLTELLKSTTQVKIFHSARQDLEVLHTAHDCIPTPIFDSQIAASMLGPDEQISYAELVRQHLAVDLPKSQSRTDWSRRPLSAAQIAYALDDVRYLGPLYETLSPILAEKNRTRWLIEECEQLAAPLNYFTEPANAWKNVKGVGKTHRNGLLRIQQLAYWRELEAQNRNRPRQWILKDRAIVDLANMHNDSLESITNYLRNEHPKSLRYKESIISQLQQGRALEPQAKLTAASDRRLSKPQQALTKSMMHYIKQHAEEIGTAPALLANRKSIENLVLGKSSKVMSGWRKSVIGDDLQKMLTAETS